MKRSFWPIISIFCLAAAGCASSETVLRKQVELEGTVEQLTRQGKAQESRIAELSQSLRDLQQRMKGTEADLNALRPGFDQLKASNDALYERIAQLHPSPAAGQGGEGASPRVEALGAPAPVQAQSEEPAPKGGGQEGYARAFAVYNQGDYPRAIDAFEAFVRAEPGSELAPNALYWAGECYYAQKKFAAALASFQRVVNEYPKARKVPDAMLKIGFTLIGMKEPVRARGELQSLVEKYPKSPAAVKAREKLGHL